jgi:hypothetical protein
MTRFQRVSTGCEPVKPAPPVCDIFPSLTPSQEAAIVTALQLRIRKEYSLSRLLVSTMGRISLQQSSIVIRMIITITTQSALFKAIIQAFALQNRGIHFNL